MHYNWFDRNNNKLGFITNQQLYVCMCFTALITTLVSWARFQDLVMSVSVRRVHVVFSTAGYKGGGKPFVVRHVKPQSCREASRKPRALSRVWIQAIGALAQDSYPLSYPSAQSTIFIFSTNLLPSRFEGFPIANKSHLFRCLIQFSALCRNL